MASPLWVLIVDDDEMMTKTLADILVHKGYRAVTAHSAREALDKADRMAFDCIFSDIRMPEMDGVTLHREVRRRYGDLPMALMTAYSETQLIQEGLRSGVIAVFTKPINLEMLFLFLGHLPNEIDEFISYAHQRAANRIVTRLNPTYAENGST